MRTHNTRRRWLILLAVLAVFALVAGAIPLAAAAPPADRGPGNGGGGGGGGGGGRDVTYADLVFILRYVDGLPIHITFPFESEVEVQATADADEYVCVQPISYDAQKPALGSEFDVLVEGATNGNGAAVWKVPLWGSAVEHPDLDYTYEQLEEELGVEPCDVIDIEGAAYAQFVHEVPLSRLNLGRAPDRVLKQQYAEVTKMLLGSEIGLDASGRLTADGLAIDSSPMNQSIYRELMLRNELFPKDKQGRPIGGAEAFDLTPTGKTNLEIAAMALGVAGDKSTPFSIDTIGYMNRIYRLFEDAPHTVLPTLTDAAGEEFIDFAGFSYDRADTYYGCFIGYIFDGTTPVEVEGTLLDLVFGGHGFASGNVTAFAKLADDARRVNLYLHDAAGVLFVDDLGSTLDPETGKTAVCGMLPYWTTEESAAERMPLPDGGEWLDAEESPEEVIVVVIDRGRNGRAWID